MVVDWLFWRWVSHKLFAWAGLVLSTWAWDGAIQGLNSHIFFPPWSGILAQVIFDFNEDCLSLMFPLNILCELLPAYNLAFAKIFSLFCQSLPVFWCDFEHNCFALVHTDHFCWEVTSFDLVIEGFLLSFWRSSLLSGSTELSIALRQSWVNLAL
jgi:hypothetical protein